MLPIDWKLALHYANLVRIAEAVDPGRAYQASDAQAIQQAGYAFQQALVGSDLATDIDPHVGSTVTFGFTAVSTLGELVAVIRGTDTIWEWLHDASFLLVPNCITQVHGPTEDGFAGVYRSLRTGADNRAAAARVAIDTALSTGNVKKIVICGHSLGGALATLLALDLAVNSTCRDLTVYTYASPRVGDHMFAAAYNAAIPFTYRIVNRQDLVPQVPPVLPLPYKHVNTFYELSPPPGAMTPSIPCMHHLTTYMWLIDQQVGSGTWKLNPECCPAGAVAAASPAPTPLASSTESNP